MQVHRPDVDGTATQRDDWMGCRLGRAPWTRRQDAHRTRGHELHVDGKAQCLEPVPWRTMPSRTCLRAHAFAHHAFAHHAFAHHAFAHMPSRTCLRAHAFAHMPSRVGLGLGSGLALGLGLGEMGGWRGRRVPWIRGFTAPMLFKLKGLAAAQGATRIELVAPAESGKNQGAAEI